MEKVSKYTFVCVILMVLSIVTVACGIPATPSSVASSRPVIEIIGETNKEALVVETEIISQPNCNGSSELENEVSRSRSIAHTIEVGAGVEVSADGQVGILGTQVGLGTTIASQLGYSYGTTEDITKAIRVRASAGTSIEHTIRLQEIWEVGNAKIVVNGEEHTLPFRFRRDFAIELVDSKPADCENITSTATLTHTTISDKTQELYVFTEGTRKDTYIIKGSKFSKYNVGDDLVVYGEITPGTPIAIALLKVTAKNPDSLSAQVLLIHPGFPVRTNLRVDSRLDYISESELIPSPEFALGYFLRPGRIRLRPNSGVKENSVLQALDFEMVGGVQLDALPFVPPIKMLVQAVGAEGNIASVELIEGSWPITGTIVSGVIVEPTPLPPTPTNTGTPLPPTSIRTDTPTPLATVQEKLQIEIKIGDTIEDGQPSTGAGYLDAPGEQDIYVFEATAGQQVFFDILTYISTHTSWVLTDPDGIEVFDEPVWDDLVYLLRKNGQYTLTVNSNQSESTGPYSFRLWEVPDPKQFSINIGDTIEDGQPSIGAGYLDVPGEQDIYVFEATTGQQVFFDILTYLNVRVSWVLMDPDDIEVFDEPMYDDSVHTLRKDGLYTLTVNSNQSGFTGPYSFSLSVQ